MSNKKLEQAMDAMNRAFTPRDEQGLLLPMEFENEPGQKVLVPYVEPDENGLTRGMIFAEEFVDGKIPSYLRYEEAIMFTEKSHNGRSYEQYMYTNPVLNLPWRDFQAYQIGRQVRSHTISRQAQANSKSDLNIMTGEEEKVTADVIDRPEEGCLAVMTGSGYYPLTNFRIKAVEYRVIHGRNEKEPPEREYEIHIIYGDRIKAMTLAPKDVDNVIKHIQIQMPMCTISPNISKPNALIINFLRGQLASLPERNYIQRTGFMKIHGHWVYVHDGADSPATNTVFRTGRTIPRDTRMTPLSACLEALAFMQLSEKPQLMVPLFLLAHLGPMFKLFEQAGHVPRFLGFLSGRSGSLKTAMSLCLFRLFAEQPDSPEANFKDTDTALEIKLGEINSRVLVVDDYRPPVTATNGRQNAERLESVVRFVGDRISKSRSNPELGKAKEFAPSGMVLVTAEDVGGSHSSHLRMLVLSISKGDVDGKKLRRYQENPLLFGTHMFHFLVWCGQQGDRIINMITSDFPREREYFEGILQELRLVDTAVTLTLTARILSNYVMECGAVQGQAQAQLADLWRAAILQAVTASESLSKEANPVCLYLNAFFNLWEHGEINIAPSVEAYTSGISDGYIKDGCVWLWQKEVYGKIRKYYQRFDLLFPLTLEQTSVHLADAELIDVVYENRGGTTKRLFVKRSALPERQRMMVLRVEQARKYLEHELSS